MDKRFLAILAAILLIFGGLFWYSAKNSSSNTGDPTNHITGKLDSPVTLVEYGDYQCNACQAYSATTNAVKEKYKDYVKFQFRNLPLQAIHPNAFAGARAAEAADKQGKFWEMHDLLYQYSNWAIWTNSKNPNQQFEAYAQQLGLNITQFKADFKSSEVNQRINADMAAFDATKAEKATPAYFINGTKIELKDLVDANNQPQLDKFSAIIDKALTEKGITPPAATAPAAAPATTESTTPTEETAPEAAQ